MRYLTSKRSRRAAIVAITLALISGALLISAGTRMTPYVRDRAVAALNARFQSKVDMAALRVGVYPRPEVSGQGLTVRHNGRTDVPPLITIASYAATAGLMGLVRSPLHLKTIELEGLDITIPPGGLRTSSDRRDDSRKSDSPPEPVSKRPDDRQPRLLIDRLVSRAARLAIVPRDPGKLPRVFDIHDLVMENLGDGGGAPFHATLTNPTPRGDITTQGTFGPWRADEPRLTPLRGDYVFRNANLNTIKGIAGMLSSLGTYSGVLERINVEGETDTPDFSIDIAEQPVSLKTRFRAVVDGTNGNTWLELVEARLIDTLIVASGAVVRTEDVRGRKVALDVHIDDGRIEDVLKLSVKSATPLMTGRMQLKASFLLPAGDRRVSDRLELDGTFVLDRARFANVSIQERINTLSHRGRGHEEGTVEASSVVSRLTSRFTLRRRTLTLTDLSFAVPGAIVQLAGTYDMKAQIVDFRGHLLLDASLADTTSGFKSLVARMAQPLFRRPGGGSKLPIRISGPWTKPEFGLDVRRALTRGD